VDFLKLVGVEKMLGDIFIGFPREMAVPERFKVNSLEEFFATINRYNGKKRIFTSLYAEKPILNFVWFDLDSDKCFENIKKLDAWATEKNYKHFMDMSGGGFHFYLFTKNYENLKNPKKTLFNCHKFIAKEIGLTIGNPEQADIDEHIIGDIRRVATVPNTWNCKRRLYAIPVTKEDLNTNFEAIKEKAKKQQFEYKFYGTELFDVFQFDSEIEEFMAPLMVNEKSFVEVKKDEALLNLPNCIKAWLSLEWPGYERRGWIIMWLRDNGLWRKELDKPFPAMHEEAISILKQYLQPEEFRHMIEQDANQPYYLYYRNRNNSFPSCKKLKEYGNCPGKPDEYCNARIKFLKFAKNGGIGE
jgi:hypothetical protein